jgi:hypothetical protein
MKVCPTTFSDHFNTSLESVELGHEGDERDDILAVSGLIRLESYCDLYRHE